MVQNFSVFVQIFVVFLDGPATAKIKIMKICHRQIITPVICVGVVSTRSLPREKILLECLVVLVRTFTPSTISHCTLVCVPIEQLKSRKMINKTFVVRVRSWCGRGIYMYARGAVEVLVRPVVRSRYMYTRGAVEVLVRPVVRSRYMYARGAVEVRS